jgi:hypothetical protein
MIKLIIQAEVISFFFGWQVRTVLRKSWRLGALDNVNLHGWLNDSFAARQFAVDAR